MVRIEAPNALDRIQFDIDDNRSIGFSDDEILRSHPMWDGAQSWGAGGLGRVPGRGRGAGHRRRSAGLPAAAAGGLGRAGGLAGTVLKLRYSLDTGATWADSGAEVTLSGTGDETTWGAFVDIPDALRQSIGVVLAMSAAAATARPRQPSP